jgi:hypothetical protein
MLEFVVKYEGIPYFCFNCSRIGHTVHECPEEENEEGVRFGTELRASLLRRQVGRSIAIQPVKSSAKRWARRWISTKRQRRPQLFSWPTCQCASVLACYMRKNGVAIF